LVASDHSLHDASREHLESLMDSKNCETRIQKKDNENARLMRSASVAYSFQTSCHPPILVPGQFHLRLLFVSQSATSPPTAFHIRPAPVRFGCTFASYSSLPSCHRPILVSRPFHLRRIFVSPRPCSSHLRFIFVSCGFALVARSSLIRCRPRGCVSRSSHIRSAYRAVRVAFVSYSLQTWRDGFH